MHLLCELFEPVFFVDVFVVFVVAVFVVVACVSSTDVSYMHIYGYGYEYGNEVRVHDVDRGEEASTSTGMRRPLTISVFETSVDLDKRVLRQPRFGGIGVCKRERSKSTKNTEVCCAAKSRCGCRMQLYFFFFFLRLQENFLLFILLR